MNHSFFLWYYTLGLKGAFVVWFNFVRAVWLRGNAFDLLQALVAPWHKIVLESADWEIVRVSPLLSAILLRLGFTSDEHRAIAMVSGAEFQESLRAKSLEIDDYTTAVAIEKHFMEKATAVV